MKHGVAFSDYITTGKVSRHEQGYQHDDWHTNRMRGFFLLVLLVIFCGVLFMKLFFLQVIGGGYYRGLSDSNRIRTVIIHAPRGIIFDRNGTPLVFNIPGYRQIVNKKTQLLTREKALTLLASGAKDLEVDALREYPYKDAFVHVLGYDGQISQEELQEPFYAKYHVGDLIGKMGIEQQYEDKLRGIDGKKLIEVDNLGKPTRTLGQTDPIPGQDIQLTLDTKLQNAAFLALSDVKKGSVIVSTPKGEILALVSKPSFDPNLFTLDETYKVASTSAYKTVTEALQDFTNQPFLNRAIAGLYPPGSTFKIITAAAGLETNTIDEHFEVEDTGVLRVGDFSFANWYFIEYGKKEGFVNIVLAIKRSNDTFFYKLAEKEGVDMLSKMASKFGVGQKLGIDLTGEKKGLLPTASWKKNTLHESWYLGDTYHYGIGQGYLLVTPLQVNEWTQVIANNGVRYQPHVLKNAETKIQESKFLNDKTTGLIHEGMVASCNTGGVAWPLFEFKVKNPTLRLSSGQELQIDGKNILESPQATISADFKQYRKISIVCKTGTAQHGGEDTLPHAWITLFAPAYDPQIVVTVLAESSGEGSNIAAPIAKKILEEWFKR